MRDLTDQLAALHGDDLSPAGDEQVSADLARGRAALRRRRTLIAVCSTAVVAAATVVGVALGTGTTAHPGPIAKGPTSSAPASPGSSPALKLVAWRGKQLKGYTVARVPKGYVLQGVSASVLDIAAPRDKSDIDVFEDKLVVMLDDFPTHEGTRVQIGKYQGWYSRDDGVQALTYEAFGRHVHIQCWKNIELSRSQLIAFARGVTVTADAVPGHG